MKNLIRLYNYLLILIAAFPLIGMRIEVYAIALMCVFAIIIILKNNALRTLKNDWKPLLILCSYYLMAVVSFLIFSDDIHEALNDLETKAAFIIFPLFIYLCKDHIYQETIKIALIGFVISNVLICTYVWILIFNEGFLEMLKLDSHYNPLFRNIFIENSDIYIPYLGLLYGFSCILIGHFYIKKKRNFYVKVGLILVMAFFLFSMAIFSARMAILALVVSAFYYLINVINKKSAVAIIGIVLIIVVLISFLQPIQRRVKEVISSELLLPSKEQMSDKVNFRYGIYYCSKEVLKNNWLIGVGLGDVQRELNHCYQGFDYQNFDDFKLRKYNSHNQFLNEWMTYGIIGLCLFLLFILYCFKNGSVLHKSFIILIFFGLLTENLFEREIGVVLFALFNTLFFVLKRADEELI
jgi:O-antigen ligase